MDDYISYICHLTKFMNFTISESPVFIGNNSISNLSLFLKQKNFTDSSFFILLDENTHKYCLPKLITSVEQLKGAEIIEIESGDLSKNIEICSGIWQTMLELGADKNSVIINLGGGVVCDLGGFISSLFKRGIRFINIPTSLMAMVDAGIGGKTGVNIGEIKNQIGSFANPEAVFIDTDFLSTLTNREIMSGFAEIIKYALIYDASLWKKIKETNTDDISLLYKLILRCVEIKAQITDCDPYEKNIRKILNFGHTIGHAIETVYMGKGKNAISHGEAVAHGIVMESFISSKIKGFSLKQTDEITGFIFSKYKPIKFSKSETDKIIETMKFDKKNTNGETRFSLIKSIGTASYNNYVETNIVKESFEYYNTKAKHE